MIKIQTTTKELNQMLVGGSAEKDLKKAVEKFTEWFNEDSFLESRYYDFLYDGAFCEQEHSGICLLQYLYIEHGYCVRPSGWVLSKDPLPMKEKSDSSEEVICS